MNFPIEVQMDKPIIFPFTYLGSSALDAIHRWLGVFQMLQLAPGLVPDNVREAAGQGKLDIRYQEKVDPERLVGLLEDYRLWADQFGRDGTTLALFYQQRQGLPPLLDEDAPSRIRNQIRQMAGDGAGTAASRDPFLEACLILAMAQFYDRQQEEIEGQLQAISAMERELYAGLKGEPEVIVSGSPSLPTGQEPGTVKTPARLVSWSLLAANSKPVPMFWVTTSQAVIEYILEREELEQVAELDLKESFDPETLDNILAEPGSMPDSSPLDLGRVEPPGLVLLRLQRPWQKFPFNRLEGRLPEKGPPYIVLGWLRL